MPFASGFFAVWSAAGYGLAEIQSVTPALLAHRAPEAITAVHREATSTALAAIVCCQLGNVLACRSDRIPAARLALPATPFLRWGMASELAILLAIVYLQAFFGTGPVAATAWPWLLRCAPAIVLLDDARKTLGRFARSAARNGRSAEPAPAPGRVRLRDAPPPSRGPGE